MTTQTHPYGLNAQGRPRTYESFMISKIPAMTAEEREAELRNQRAAINLPHMDSMGKAIHRKVIAALQKA